MAQATTALFGVLTAPMGADAHHVFGGIFKQDAQGRVVDFTPIDFDGTAFRDHPRNRGLPIPITEHDPMDYIDKALFFPITTEAATAMTQAVDQLKATMARGESPFYYASGLRPDPRFERKGRPPLDFDGTERAVCAEQMQQYARLPDAKPRIGTNCRHFLLNLMEKVGGIPLGNFRTEREVLSPQMRTEDIRALITELAGNKGYERLGRVTGKLHGAGVGQYFYAYDGGGPLCQQLNKHCGLALAMLMQHSAPLTKMTTQAPPAPELAMSAPPNPQWARYVTRRAEAASAMAAL